MGNGELSSSATSKLRSSGSTTSKIWTNKRHVDYLNSMEASFVRSLLNSLPLNRDLPDTCDSTLDRRTPPARPRRYSTSDILESSGVKSDKRTRRLPYRPYNAPIQDQVVPQFESRRANNITDDDDDKDYLPDANDQSN